MKSVLIFPKFHFIFSKFIFYRFNFSRFRFFPFSFYRLFLMIKLNCIYQKHV